MTVQSALSHRYLHGAYRGRMDNPLFMISTSADTNRAETYIKNVQWILQLSKRLQNVEILNRDFRKVLHSYNAEDVFVYADCPYLGTEDYYDYVFTVQDHKDLAGMLKVEVFDEIESIDTQYAGKIKAVTDELWQIKAQLELV